MELLASTRRKAAGDLQFAVNVASTIAWAVEHDAPIGSALRSLLPPVSRQFAMSFFGTPFLSGFLYPLLQRRAHYYAGVRKTVTDLDRGIPLHAALQQNLGHVLPMGFVVGLRTACDEGREKEVIPVLARSLQQMANPRPIGGLNVLYLLVAGVLSAIGTGLHCFVIPRFRLMVLAVGEGSLKTPVFNLLCHSATTTTIRIVGMLVSFIVAVYVVTLAIGYVAARVDPESAARRRWLGLSPFAWVPFIGSRVRLQQQLVAAQIMHGCLVAGADLITAASSVGAALDGTIIGNRWRQFVHLHYCGVPARDAIVQANVSDPITQWVMLARMGREQAAEGFLFEANILAARLERLHQFRHRILCIFAVMFLGTAVGLFAYGMFEPLFGIIDHMAQMEI